MHSLTDAKIPKNKAKQVLDVFWNNPRDAAVDVITSKALKEAGYDSMILIEGKAKHIFVLDVLNII